MILACGLALSALTIPVTADPESWMGEGWQTDFSKSSVGFDGIISGGPPRDGIPSIDEPQFITASEVTDIEDREPVIQFPLEGRPRAYPLRILTWHEIVNDVVDDVPVAVTYCPLCNAAIVFDRRLDGQVLEFGTTGKLRHSDLVMYDRQTETWWQQFAGEAIIGELTGASLRMMPSRIVSFGQFRVAYPGGQVLVANDPRFRPYGDNPYVGYDTADAPFLFKGELPDNVPAMAHVVVVRTGDGPIIVTLDRVRKGGFQQEGYRIDYSEGVASALDSKTIGEGRETGTVRVTKDGKDVVHDLTFAFVAHAFHPESPIIDD
ncbi:hypothetical protein ACSSV1_005853 [Labrenzia sp. MBR-25]|jgi:hypothetical protein